MAGWKQRFLTLTPPDYEERRGGRRLLVWGGIPHWMVVDEDLYALLEAQDGTRPLEAVVRSRPARAAALRDILALARKLSDLGVLRDVRSPAQADKPDRSDKSSRIENIAVNITRRCNLRCRFCYNKEVLVRGHPDELSADEIIAVLRSARRLVGRRPSLMLLGGEPLLEPEKTLAVARYGIRHGFETQVSTNGTRVTEAFAREARRIGLLVQVSVDGHTAALNDAVRGEGSFHKIVRGIRTLVANGAHTILSMVCHQGNVDHIEDFFRFAQSLGADEARFIPLKIMGGARDRSLKPVSMKRLILRTHDLFRQHPGFLKMAGRDAFGILAAVCSFSARRPSCGTGLQTFLLDSDGALYPCLNTNMPEFRIASVRDAGFDFRRLWKQSEKLRNHRVATCVHTMNERCAACAFRHWCLGGCRGETYAVRGSLSAPAYNCADLRRAIVEMFWILADHPEMTRAADITCLA